MNSVDRQVFYHHPYWFRAYFDRPTVEVEDISFHCVFDGERLIAVLPLEIRKRGGGTFSEARMPASDGLYLPDMALSQDADSESVWRLLRDQPNSRTKRRWDWFSMQGVLETSAINLCTQAPFVSAVPGDPQSRCAVLDITPYQEKLASLSKKFRGNLNNARNRLGANGTSEFLCITETKDIEWAFEEFVSLEESGWKGDQNKKKKGYPAPAAIALKESKHRFYKNVVKAFAAIGAVEVCLLKLGEKTIGAQVLVVLSGNAFLLKTAFDEDAKGYSPGHLLIDYAVRRYDERGDVVSLHLLTDYPWFKPWNPRYVAYGGGKEFNSTMRGILASYLFTLANIKKRKFKNNDKAGMQKESAAE